MRAILRIRSEFEQYRRSLVLLIDRRVGFVVVVDLLLLVGLLVAALVEEEGGSPRGLYQAVVVLPMVLLGVPLLADVIALERRAGSLDLALTTSGGSTCFIRRIVPVCALLAVQGGGVMCIEAMLVIQPFPLILVLLQTVMVSALIGALTLFWAVRLKSPGAVGFATLLSIIALGRWLFWNPIPNPTQVVSDGWFLSLVDSVDWATNNVVLAITTILLYLDIRRRLDHPESLLA